MLIIGEVEALHSWAALHGEGKTWTLTFGRNLTQQSLALHVPTWEKLGRCRMALQWRGLDKDTPWLA